MNLCDSMVSLGSLLAVDDSGASSSRECTQQLQDYINAAENGGDIDIQAFHQTCTDASAFVLTSMGADSSPSDEGLLEVIRLLCSCPAYVLTPNALETGVYVWKLLVSSAAHQLGSLVIKELVDAWLWTIDKERGLFASGTRYSGPASKLRPHLEPGVPELPPERDPVEGIMAHKLWIGFFADWFEEVIQHGSVEQLMHLGRLLQGTMKTPSHKTSQFSRHPNAAGTFFSVMLLGLKFCSWQGVDNMEDLSLDYKLLEDQVYRASLDWFVNRPGFHDTNQNFAKNEAQSVLLFTQFLLNQNVDSSRKGGEKRSADPRYSLDQYHPVQGKMDNYANGREKRKHLLIILCHHEADRLDVWANPTKARKNVFYRLKLSSDKGMEYKFYRLKYNSEKWIELARTAFSVDPQIAFSLVSRFPSVSCLKAEVTQLVQSHTTEIPHIPEALPYLLTPEVVPENSTILEQLPHWEACSVAQALAFLTPAYASNPHIKVYVLRVLESYSPESVARFMSQLVQTLRYGDEQLVVQIAQRSILLSHMLIWHVQRDRYICCLIVRDQKSSFQDRLRVVKQRIIDGFTPEARDLFQRESDFLDKITSISGSLLQYPKEERRAVIKRELEKLDLNGGDLYLPTAPSKLIQSIQYDSGTPLQSATRAPIMITFNVVDRDDHQVDSKSQACIFKVGDDCRQDVLALQVISLLRDIFEAVGIDLYLFPYGVLPTGPQRGVIEVVPNTRSRSQMGERDAGDLFEIFQHRFGPVRSPSFETARDNFMRSSAGYAVASLLLQLKDRHNGNILFDNSTGRLVHVDFGFILGISPGGNLHFENAQFKLSHDMTRLLDPSGSKKSETWMHFVSLCIKGYLAARLYMDEFINTVQLMVDSGLPCFSKGDPIGHFRKRFHPEMSDRQAATFMIRTCEDAYNKWTTALYDSIQYWQHGIKK